MTRTDRTIGILAVLFMLALISVFGYFVYISGGIEEIFLIGQDDEEKGFRRIEFAYDVSDYDRALYLSSDFLAEYPDSVFVPRVYIISAEILFNRGDYEGARRQAIRVLSRRDSNADDFADSAIILGKIMKETSQYDRAGISFLENAFLKADASRQAKLAVYLGYYYLLRNDYRYALNYFNQATGEYSLIGRADIYILQNKTSEAIQEFLNYFSLYPRGENIETVKTNFFAQSFKHAQRLESQSMDGAAIEYYLNIVNNFRNTDDADLALYNIAEIYYKNKNYDSAILFLKRVLSHRSRFANDKALFRLGVIYYETDKKIDALRELRRLVNEYPDSLLRNQAQEWIDVISTELLYS